MAAMQLAGGREENTLDSIIMLWNDDILNAVNMLFFWSVVGLNIFGLMVTQVLGSVFRAVMLTARTASVHLLHLEARNSLVADVEQVLAGARFGTPLKPKCSIAWRHLRKQLDPSCKGWLCSASEQLQNVTYALILFSETLATSNAWCRGALQFCFWFTSSASKAFWGCSCILLARQFLANTGMGGGLGSV